MKKLFILAIILLGLLISCNLNEISGNDEQNETADLEFSISLAKSPVPIMSMSGFLSKSGEDTIHFDFVIEDNIARCKVKNIKPGEWQLTVNAYNANYELAYTGTTKVIIKPGEETTVYLHLDPATGSLKVIVTWGDNGNNEKMILMAIDSISKWHIISLDINGNHFRDLGYGMYPVWPTKDRSVIYFLSDYYTLCKLDLNSNQIDTVNYLPYNTNFLRYSESLNKFLFDYRVNKYSQWQLGLVNVDGSGFQTILRDDTYKKYPITPTHNDWIYFHKEVNGKRKIFKIKENGSKEKLFIEEEGDAEFPAISYDDHKIAYISKNSNQEYYINIRNIHTFKLEKKINLTSFGIPTYPAFTKNGQYIVVSVITGPNWEDRQLFRINIANSDISQITFGNQYKYYARPIFW